MTALWKPLSGSPTTLTAAPRRYSWRTWSGFVTEIFWVWVVHGSRNRSFWSGLHCGFLVIMRGFCVEEFNLGRHFVVAQSLKIRLGCEATLHLLLETCFRV